MLFELLILVFLFHIYFPSFPYIRIVVNGIAVFIILAFFGFLGPHYGSYLFEAAWLFLIRDIVGVLPI